MKRSLALILLIAAVSVVASAQISVLEISGVVEVRSAGSWQSVTPGDVISRDSVIATGFRSTALLQIGASRVTVEPLTELTVSELSTGGATEQVGLSLPFGRIRAEVNTERSVQAINFQVRSPVSTAAVRGTTFTYDGVELNVFEGRVALSNAYGQWHSVAAGQESRAYRWSISSVETVAAEEAAGR